MALSAAALQQALPETLPEALHEVAGDGLASRDLRIQSDDFGWSVHHLRGSAKAWLCT
jgi:hypothetical protein